MFAVSLLLVAREDFVPLIIGDYVFVACVIPDRALGLVHIHLDFALSRAQKLSSSLLHALLLGHELRIAAEQNIGSAPGHVGGDGDHAFAASLGDDFGFFFVVLDRKRRLNS